ncbi:MAG: response regulator [Deltaproteobacteria bacterium]|nr:response regulator [Deltaproteobacteria bacterium]
MESFLIVDDDARLWAIYKSLMGVKFRDALISCAGNGIEALQKAGESDYSLIISDIDMPEMDGIDFHKNMKRDYPFLARKTVFITGSTNRADISYMEQENILWLLKPFNPYDFYDFIEKALRA